MSEIVVIDTPQPSSSEGKVVMLSSKKTEAKLSKQSAIGIEDVFRNRDMFFTRTITDLDSDSYRVKKPIKYIIEYIEGEVIGDVEELEIYSFGVTLNEVIRVIKQEIIELYDELINKNDEKLGYKPRKWKNYLINHIEKLNGY